MTKKILLSFVNKGYMSTQRFLQEATESNFFDNIIIKNEDDIPEFIEKHKNFIKSNKSGYGCWIWKPKIIIDTLNSMKDGDFLIYCDAGSHINKNGHLQFNHYLNTLSHEKPIGVFSTTSNYTVKNFVKRDAIMHYYPEFDVKEDQTYVYAGLMIIKKNNFSLNFIKEWLELCENYNFLDRSISKNFKEKRKFFIGNDCDAGLFALCTVKHKENICYLGKDEIMVYSKDGVQYHHLDKKQQRLLNWETLQNKPFQARRLTPKLYRHIS